MFDLWFILLPPMRRCGYIPEYLHMNTLFFVNPDYYQVKKWCKKCDNQPQPVNKELSLQTQDCGYFYSDFKTNRYKSMWL